MSRYQELLTEYKRREEMLDSAKGVLAFDEGERLFFHIFKMLGVSNGIPQGLTGEQLHEELGFQRAGQEIMKIMMEASPLTVNKIMNKIDQERIRVIKEEFDALLEREKHNV